MFSKKSTKKRAIKKVKPKNTVANIQDIKRTVSSTKRTNLKQISPRKKTINNSEFLRMKKRKRSRQSTRFFAVVIMILFIFYIGGYFIVMFNRDITTSHTLTVGTIDSPVKIEGVIIRDEKVYNSPEAGILEYLVGDLEKIKVNTIIATIKNAETDLAITDELKNINKEILSLQERRDDFSIAQKDAKRLDSQIKKLIDENIYEFSNNNISGLYNLKQNIDKKINLRNKILLEENRGSLKNLSSSREVTLQELYKNEHTITTDESGIVSYLIDDFENVFTFSTMYGIKKENLINIEKDKVIITNKKVEKNDVVFKLVKSNLWYIGAFVENSVIEEWKEGTYRNIYIENGKDTQEMEIFIDKIIPDKKESFILLKATKNMLDYIEQRKITFKTSESAVFGIKIPNSAITQITELKIPKEFIISGGNNKVKKRNPDGTIEEIYFETSFDIGSDEETWIIQAHKGIMLGDTIVNPFEDSQTYKIEESQNVKAVYKINSGLAKMVKINIDEKLLDTEGFLVIDPKYNKGLKEYDMIILDATQVNEGQKIYRK